MMIRLIKNREGRNCRVVAVFPETIVGGRSIIAVTEVDGGFWSLNSYYANGRFYADKADKYDLLLNDQDYREIELMINIRKFQRGPVEETHVA